jgi:hypothetical protein
MIIQKYKYRNIKQYVKRNSHMYSYPNVNCIPSSDCSTPCSPRLSLHFTSLLFGFTPFKFSTISFHFMSPHFTSLHCTFRWFSAHFYYVHFTPFIIAFLSLFLKILGLHGKVPNTCADSWIQIFMFIFTKEYFLKPILGLLSLIFRTLSTLLR